MAVVFGGFAGRSSMGVERRIRGLLYEPILHTRSLRLDRSIQLEGCRGLRPGSHVTLYGGSHFVAREDRPIRIGVGSHIGRNCVFSGLGGISVGERCAISSAVVVYSISHDVDMQARQAVLASPIRRSEVRIGDCVWIGAGAIVLPGITIEDHAIIAAGAVVTKDVERWAVVAGVPARVIRFRKAESIVSPAELGA